MSLQTSMLEIRSSSPICIWWQGQLKHLNKAHSMLQAHLITQTLSFFSSKTVQLKYTINILSLGICISPVNIDKSQYWPLLYHNPLIAHKLLHGFRHGFSLKLTGTRIALCCKDMVSATDNQNHLLTKLQKEILLDRIFGPFKHFSHFKYSLQFW